MRVFTGLFLATAFSAAAVYAVEPVAGTPAHTISHAEAAEMPVGHSASFFGMTVRQHEPSLRAVLEAFDLDTSTVAPTPTDAVAFVLLKMFGGGGGAPVGLVRARGDLDTLVESDCCDQSNYVKENR
jgi:hypothetical protein